MRVATNAGLFLEGLLGDEQRKTGVGCAQRQLAILALGGNRRFPVAEDWDADGLRDIVCDYVIEHLADDDAVLVIDETGFLKQGKASVRSGAGNTLVSAAQDHELPDRGFRCLRFAPRSCVRRSRAVSSEGMDRRSRSPGGRVRAPRCRLCDQTTACDENGCTRHRRVCTIQVGCRRYGLRCWRYRKQLRRAGKGYVLGVSSAHVFQSWGKQRSVAGKAADIARTRRSSGRETPASAGAGTSDRGCMIGAILELADLEVEEFSSANQGLYDNAVC